MRVLIAVLFPLIGLSGGLPVPECRLRRLEQVYQWTLVRFATPPGYTPHPGYQPNLTFISGVDIAPDRMILATSREGSFNPATLSYVPLYPISPNTSPVLQPYPNLAWNTPNSTNCNATLVSVPRTTRDRCNRLWAIDTGVALDYFNPQVICPPKIVIFNLTTHQMVRIIQIPSSVLTPVSSLTSIALEPSMTSLSCDNTYVYLADNSGNALVVGKSPENTFHRFQHPTMFPDPDDAVIVSSDGVKFQYFRGIKGIDVGGTGLQRYLYYLAIASKKVYYVPTSALHGAPPNDSSQLPVREAFRKDSQSSALIVDDSDDCVLVNPITQGSLLSFNPATRIQRTVVERNPLIMTIEDYNQATSDVIYAASTRVDAFISGRVNASEINMRILKIIQT